MARCPYCGSTNARSINNVQQVLAEIAGASGALLGGQLRLPGKVTYRNVRDAKLFTSARIPNAKEFFQSQGDSITIW